MSLKRAIRCSKGWSLSSKSSRKSLNRNWRQSILYNEGKRKVLTKNERSLRNENHAWKGEVKMDQGSKSVTEEARTVSWGKEGISYCHGSKHETVDQRNQSKARTTWLKGKRDRGKESTH